jgi:hypothetical protein
MLFVSVQSSGIARAEPADQKAAAREHFLRGVSAFDDRRFGEAAQEFETAYKLSPAFVVLYNIGQVDVVLGRSVDAVEAFDRYLKQGASAVSAERRQEVEAEIERQNGRIGAIGIRTTPEAVEIRIDGRPAGKTPLPAPVRVDMGKHTLEATLAGYQTQVRDLDIAGRAEIDVQLALQPNEPTAPIVTPLPSAAPEAPSPAPERTPEPAAVPTESSVVEKTFIERTFVEAPPTVQQVSRPARSEPSYAGTIQRAVGLVVMAGGIATATVGGIEAYRGANQANDASNRLASATTGAQYDAALPDYNAGKSLNQRGWIIAGIGAAVVAGGVVVFATAPERSSSVNVASWVTSDSGGVIVRGVW